MPSGLHRPTRSLFHWAVPSRPSQACRISDLLATTSRRTMWEIQTHVISVLLGHTPQECTGLLCCPQPKACRAGDINTHDLCSAGQGPPGLHKYAQYPLCKLALLRPAKPGNHTRTISILLSHAPQACQSRYPHPPATHNRKSPNLPRRHTQTGLDAKELT
jgi:hypothetical protein